MKRPQRRLLRTAAFGAVLSLSATSWAMPPGHDSDFDGRQIVSHMAKRLAMSDQQQAEIEAIFAAGAEQTDADRARLAELKRLLHAQVVDFDAGDAQVLADEIGEISARLSYSRTAAFADVYQLLDEEQRATLRQWRQKREQRRDNKRDRLRAGGE